MAKMIPSVISPEIKSAAEKHIFEWFRDDPRTSDWIVLHSLGISNHNTVIHGETDFFILVPYMGLFALEVKGGRVKRKDESGLLLIVMEMLVQRSVALLTRHGTACSVLLVI